MAATPSGKPSPSKLREAFKVDLRELWQFVKKCHAEKMPYALVLYGVESYPQLFAQVLTEQSLTQVAKKYLEQGIYDTLEEAREGLRWSVADSPLFGEFEDKLPTVQSLFEPFAESLGEIGGYDVLTKAATNALAALLQEGLFGSEAEREKLTIMICVEDVQKDYTLPSAKKLNSNAVYEAYKKAITPEGPFRLARTVSRSPDGRSLYITGSRRNPG